MKRYLQATLAALIPVIVASGCNDFLQCSDCVTSPNSPTEATANQRLVAVQANLWQRLNGNLARVVSMWMQSMSGTALQYQTYDQYLIDAGTAGGDFQSAYGGGGLVDLRAIERDVRESNDQVFLGIAQVIEGWQMGTTADVWGDAPYSQAAKPDSFPTPVYDPQQVVYDSVLSVLDQAITNLQSGVGPGPGNNDLVYQGDAARWLELAHTLKARFYLHLAERDPANYAKALAEANAGISSNAGDYTTIQAGTQYQQNDWFQFILNSNRTGLISAGAFGVDLLKNTSDPRLTEYYQKGSSPDILGAAPGQSLQPWMGQVSAKRLDAGYRQPLVTYNENLLIKAEALFQAGNLGAALDTLNAERAAWATATPWHSAITLTPVAAPVTLAKIMQEKYITLFQNIESWNDYKRTCLPALTPYNGKQIPGRLLYTNSERQTNPNVPDETAQNWNDPQACS